MHFVLLLLCNILKVLKQLKVSHISMYFGQYDVGWVYNETVYLQIFSFVFSKLACFQMLLLGPLHVIAGAL